MKILASPVVVWDSRARLWSEATFATGGSPWGLIRLKPALQDFAQRLVQAGSAGLQPVGERELRAARALVHRGLAHPRALQRNHHWDVEVVVPAHDRVPELYACLRSLTHTQVLVIDDNSFDAQAILRTTEEFGARLFVRSKNGGPARATRRSATSSVVKPDGRSRLRHDSLHWIEVEKGRVPYGPRSPIRGSAARETHLR